MHSPRLNWLLAQLAGADYDKLTPHLELVGLDSGQRLFEAGQPQTDFYFPTSCTVSAQIELAQGTSCDIYLLGQRGLFGTATTHRGSFFRAIVRKPGFAYRCPAGVYMRELLHNAGVMMMSLLATRIAMETMAANTACRAFHSTGEQIARWLIAYSDAEPVDAIHITHNELANALGLRRERVTLALNEAERQGCIQLQRGQIVVRDYAMLRQLACDCDSEATLGKDWHPLELQGVRDTTAVLRRLGAAPLGGGA